MDHNDASQLWATLGEEGKAPTDLANTSRVLSSYTAGIEPWIDRLTNQYLRNLCREAAHFKLVLAPYGGGKTHFLLALGERALNERFAVSYVACGEGVSLDSPLDVYRELVKHLHLPDDDKPGLRVLLNSVIKSKREEIKQHNAPDVDAAFRRWMYNIPRNDYPENAFGRVMVAALGAEDGEGSDIGDAAFRWLQGDVDTLTKDEMQQLRITRIPSRERGRFGRNLLLSMVKFLPHADVHGLVLLIDEVETLFTAKGKALLRVLAAMRVFLDNPTGVPSGVPLFGIFSAVPDVIDEIDKRYGALAGRIAVRGAPFDAGNDLAMQLPLEKVETQETLLTEIGHKLITVGEFATGHSFDSELQHRNARQLARVATDRDLDVGARRMFVKTWVGLLDEQMRDGEREFRPEELAGLYQGTFESVKEAESEGAEP